MRWERKVLGLVAWERVGVLRCGGGSVGGFDIVEVEVGRDRGFGV